MIWIAASIFVVATIYFSIKNTHFRKWVGIVAACVAGLVACGAAYLWFDARVSERKIELSKKLIQTREIEISDSTLSIGLGGKLEATVKNNSAFKLTSVTLKISVTDCAEPADLFQKDSKCAIVGEADASDYSLEVPPFQKRRLTAYPSFSNLPDLQDGKWNWSYIITEIRGEQVK